LKAGFEASYVVEAEANEDDLGGDAASFLPVALTIRDVRRGDARALACLIGQLGYQTSADSVVRRVERLRESEVDRLVVAELDGEVVGLASLHTSLSIEYDQPAAKLSAIVVDERHRRRGIGEALVAEMEAEASRRRCCLIFLTTAVRREDAHAFYQRIGFEETGKRFAKWLG
jgi:N-acetylglutamate synthase-like GNAT family acetyltransferase